MESIGPALDWWLAAALTVLVGIAVGAARIGRLSTGWATVCASVRALLQLLAVAGVISVVLAHVWSASLFVVVMLVAATVTASGRVGARACWVWVAMVLAVGVSAVLAVVFGARAAPVEPAAIVAIGGIVVGGSMTAFVLAVRRAFAGLRERVGQVEAALALGFPRRPAMLLAIERDRPEALTPILDQTRTVGLVALPGAFIGVLLGGGSPGEAAAAQVLVLVGLLAAQTVTVVAATWLVAAGRILPDDVRRRLPAA